MDVEDLQSPEKVSTKWIKNLNSTVNKMNNTQLPMINMKPKDSIKLDIGRLGQTYPEKKSTIWKWFIHRYLPAVSLVNNMNKRRAADIIWGKKMYRLDRIVQELGSCVLHYWEDGWDRAFVIQEF